MTSFTISRLVKTYLKARNKSDHSVLSTIGFFGGLLLGGYICSTHSLLAGFLTGAVISGGSCILGRPIGTFMEDFVKEDVPDEIFEQIANSKSIPQNLKLEIHALASEGLLVMQLLEIERMHQTRRRVVSGQGYQALKRP